MNLKTTHRQSALWTVLMLVMLYLCRDSYYSGSVVGFYRSQFILFGLFGLGVVIYAWNHRKHLLRELRDPRVILFAVCAAAAFLPMAVKRDWQLMYANVLFALAVGILLSYYTDSGTLARSFLTAMAFLAVYSLICTYAMRPVVQSGLLHLRQVQGSGDGLYYVDFGLCMAEQTYLRNRNFGIFREPGVYQFFTLLSLYLNNYTAKWEKPGLQWMLNGIFVLTMLSTFSTGGVLEMGMLAVLVYFDKGWHRTRKGQLAAVGLLAAMGVAYAVIYIRQGDIFANLYMMFHKLFSDEDSWVERIGSFVLNGRLFLHSPLVGAPVRQVLNNPALVNNTSSSLILYAMLGILGGSIHVLSWLVFLWEKERKLAMNLMISFVVALSFNTENLITDPFLWLFPMLAVCEKLLPVLQARMKNKE